MFWGVCISGTLLKRVGCPVPLFLTLSISKFALRRSAHRRRCTRSQSTRVARRRHRSHRTRAPQARAQEGTSRDSSASGSSPPRPPSHGRARPPHASWRGTCCASRQRGGSLRSYPPLSPRGCDPFAWPHPLSPGPRAPSLQGSPQASPRLS